MPPKNRPTSPRTPDPLDTRGVSVCPVFPVTDLHASVAHYRALGFEADTLPDGSYAYLRSGRTEIHLLRVPELDPSTSTSSCYLYVVDADALYQRWEDSDARGFLVPPVDTPFGLREFSHVDIDGNMIRVASPLA